MEPTSLRAVEIARYVSLPVGRIFPTLFATSRNEASTARSMLKRKCADSRLKRSSAARLNEPVLTVPSLKSDIIRCRKEGLSSSTRTSPNANATKKTSPPHVIRLKR